MFALLQQLPKHPAAIDATTPRLSHWLNELINQTTNTNAQTIEMQ